MVDFTYNENKRGDEPLAKVSMVLILNSAHPLQLSDAHVVLPVLCLHDNKCKSVN